MEEERLKVDYVAITWAWGIIKERGDPKSTDEYWDDLLRVVSDKCKDENCLYKHLGTAILNTMEERYKCSN